MEFPMEIMYRGYHYLNKYTPRDIVILTNHIVLVCWYILDDIYIIRNGVFEKSINHIC